jgi:oligopeptide/dipeptide ABC transporter ATP-binding protein
MNKLIIKNLVKSYKSQKIPVLKGINLELEQGQCLGLVGESGCGKSTLAKVIMNLETFESGDILLNQIPLESLTPQKRRKIVQMVFQDPYSSLNPRMKAWEIITEPLAISGNLNKEALQEHAEEWLVRVGLSSEDTQKYPHQFSGGQRQRLGIARALITRPQFLICDEAVSALDVSIQAQILNLLLDLQKEMNLGLLFITHDLGVVRHLAHNIAVMYQGHIVEQNTMEHLWLQQKHPYSELLFYSRPQFHQNHQTPPCPLTPVENERSAKGCLFAPRCSYAKERCWQELPKLNEQGVSCFFPLV